MSSIAELYLAARQRILEASFEWEAELEQEKAAWKSQEDPSAELEESRRAWRSRDHETPWSIDKLPDPDLGDVEWQKYEPPAALYKALNVSSQVLLDLVPTSIINIRKRIAEEYQKQEEARGAADEAMAREEKGKQLSLTPEDDLTMSSLQRAESEVHQSPTSVAQSKAKSRNMLAIGSLFHRNQDNGESQAAGLSHETLRQRLEARLGSLRLGSTESGGRAQDIRAKLFGAPGQSETVECVSCLDAFTARETVKVPCHSYCRDCFIRLISAAIQNEQQWPPKCCLNLIPFKTIAKNVPDGIRQRFHERSSEWGMPASERVYCHVPGCGAWIKPSRIQLAKRQGRCERGHRTCTICRGQAHGNNDCPEDRDLNMTNMLAGEEGWKRCFSCQALVEHKEACQHMTCRCGAEFCYVCGLRWRSCDCTMQQLMDIKEEAENRRHQRQSRDQAEADELRQMLQQIEELEHQESLRLEREQEELQRLEEERRQDEMRDRTRRELQRRREVETRYQQLRRRLDELHELQHAMVGSRHEEEAEDIAEQAEMAQKRLLEEQRAARAGFDAQQQGRMRDKENAFAREFCARVSAEKKMEDEYQAALQAFWAGRDKDNGSEMVEAAMMVLWQRMDRAYLDWERWKREQLESYSGQLDEEAKGWTESMGREKREAEAAWEDKKVERARRALAEAKWVREVILERERLLNGMEVEEMEEDADSVGWEGDDEDHGQ